MSDAERALAIFGAVALIVVIGACISAAYLDWRDRQFARASDATLDKLVEIGLLRKSAFGAAGGPRKTYHPHPRLDDPVPTWRFNNLQAEVDSLLTTKKKRKSA